MRDVLNVGDIQAEPGTIARGTLGSVEVADGSKAVIPLINVNGAQDGPILTVVSGVHGPELTGIGSLLSAIKRIDPAAMRGALISIPAANPLAIRNAAYETSIDKVNLSGPMYLPPLDQETATITQKMAFHINGALEKADYVIDMHSNPLRAVPFVITALNLCKDNHVREETKKIAKAFGLTVVNNPTTKVGGIMNCAVRAGKPALTPEIPANIYIERKDLTDMGSMGILNVMKAIDMLDGDPEKQNTTVIPGDWQHAGFLYAKRGGFMFTKKEVGEMIEKGETVIEIVNVYGDVVEEVKMPVNGFCRSFHGGFSDTRAISAGSKLAFVVADKNELA